MTTISTGATTSTLLFIVVVEMIAGGVNTGLKRRIDAEEKIRIANGQLRIGLERHIVRFGYLALSPHLVTFSW